MHCFASGAILVYLMFLRGCFCPKYSGGCVEECKVRSLWGLVMYWYNRDLIVLDVGKSIG